MTAHPVKDTRAVCRHAQADHQSQSVSSSSIPDKVGNHYTKNSKGSVKVQKGIRIGYSTEFTMKRARIVLTFRSSKADAQATHIPSTDNVPQEYIAENPMSWTEVSFVLRKVVRGQLTTRESTIRGCSSKAGITACGYGAEVKHIRRDNDF